MRTEDDYILYFNLLWYLRVINWKDIIYIFSSNNVEVDVTAYKFLLFKHPGIITKLIQQL